MTQISVSVKKNAGAPNVPFKADSAKETPPKKLILNKKFFWLVLLIILAGETGTLVFLLSKKLNDLEKIMPQNAAAIISLKKDPTEKIFFSFKNKNWLWPPVNDLSKNIQDFLAQNKINFEKSSAAFEDNLMLAAFGDSADNFEWLALAKIKIGRNEFEKNLAEIKTNLEQNFDVSGETYRQIEIWQIKNLTNQSPPIFYSNAKNFFLIGSNQKKIKEAIDRALKIAK